MDKELYESCKKHLPSQLMASGELYNGQITSVEQEDYYVLSANGEWVKDPDHMNLLFTVEAVIPKTAVITTEIAKQEVRVGKSDYRLKSEYIEFSDTTILDVEIPAVTIPVKPGRNLAVILEVAAMNNRHKKMGYNAAKAFTEQIDRHFDEAMAAQREEI